MPAKILSAREISHLKEAAVILKNGGLVAFPTETVYGLGADAFNAKAVARIFEVKKRPTFDPLITHISKKEDTNRLWKKIPPLAERLMACFWPGPLTIVCEKNEALPDIVTAGLSTAAVRMPDHAAALQLIEFAGTPVAAPSANLFGYTSPTTAKAVMDDLGESIEAVLDGGSPRIGVESTVVKIEEGELVLLRPGGVTLEALSKIARVRKRVVKAGQGMESPGQTESHYAPWTPFVLLSKSYKDSSRVLKKLKIRPRIGLLAFGPVKDCPFCEKIEILSEKKDLVEAAANLFLAMRKLDKMHLDLILAEPVPAKGLGLAIMDRLTKAAAGKVGLENYLNKL